MTTLAEKRETLSEYITRLIAEADDVPPEKVTVEYIRQQRERFVYPDTRHNIGSDYGGYHGEDLIIYTRKEFDKIEEEVDKKIKEALR